ncbi:class I SAM-dependent RNA methyltransferase [Brachybacterium hainanense]|uniref:Class I SAM-dependent RNA methyltransferase n=1 Tax=Brachybacterium hainanense TaxID=1541174 RepID=A0ABV6RDV3_9MICO
MAADDPRSRASRTGGPVITVTTTVPATGGTFVARHEGRVVFVRGSAPHETVTARVIDDPATLESARFWRAETIDVLEPSVDRVPSIWPEAGTDGVGGADWAHIALPAQRRIATDVLAELLQRAKVTSFPLEDVQVEPAPHDEDGLGWRTRVRFAVDADGLVGMRGWRSHEVFPVGENPLAAPAIRELDLPSWTPPEGTEAIDAVAPSADAPAVVLIGRDLDPGAVRIPGSWGEAHVLVQNARGLHVVRGAETVREKVGDLELVVGATGFWQVHRSAATLLGDVVAQDLAVRAGDSVWDLFGGVGLFAARIGPAAGADGEVVSVEGNRRAGHLAAQNLAGIPGASARTSDAADWVRQQKRGVDRVVLDPPRAGAGGELMELLAERVRERIVYVSCEPSTLARDLAIAEQRGWRIEDLRAFDLYPHTHHLETVVVLERA